MRGERNILNRISKIHREDVWRNILHPDIIRGGITSLPSKRVCYFVALSTNMTEPDINEGCGDNLDISDQMPNAGGGNIWGV